MDKVVKLDRSDVIDTGGVGRLLFEVDTTAARAAGEIPEEFTRLVGRLVLGQAVSRADAVAAGVRVMRIADMAQIDTTDPEQLKLWGIVPRPMKKVISILDAPSLKGSPDTAM